MSVYEELRRRSATVLDERGIDPLVSQDAARQAITGVVVDYQSRSHAGQGDPLRDPERMVERIVRSVTAFGPLTPLLEREDVEEVFIEGDRVTYIEAGGRLQALTEPTTEAENWQIVARLLDGTGRRLDATSAIQQAHVLNGRARLTVVIPPIAPRLSATIRLYTRSNETLDSLVRMGVFPPAAAAFLWLLAQARSSVLFAGPTSAGKTTALAAWLRAVPRDQCVRIVEEVRELNIPLSLHSSSYEASGLDLSGGRMYDLRQLIKVSLAMRVDLLCVGEVRGAEAFELTRAMNAGAGFACTIHADSATRALSALLSAARHAGENITDDSLRMIFSESLDVVVYLDRHVTDGRDFRECREIVLVQPSTSTTHWNVEPIFERVGATMRWTGLLPDPVLSSKLERHLPADVKLPMVLEGEWFPR